MEDVGRALCFINLSRKKASKKRERNQYFQNVGLNASVYFLNINVSSDTFKFKRRPEKEYLQLHLTH